MKGRKININNFNNELNVDQYAVLRNLLLNTFLTSKNNMNKETISFFLENQKIWDKGFVA